MSGGNREVAKDMTRLIEAYKLNEKLSSLVSYLLVAGMLFCLGIAARNIIARLLPDRNIAYLPYFCFLVSLAGIYSQRKLHHSSELETNPLVYRVVEWIVILVMLKFAIYAWNGFGQFFADLPRWQANFVESFFELEFILDIVFVVIVWVLSLMFVEDLIDLEGDVNILQASNLDMVVSNRSLTQGRMANRVLTVGIVLVILATLSRLDYSTILSGLQLAKQNYLHVVAYFLLGLVLLSLTQLATRRAVWAWEHIPVGEGIARNWIAYSLGFLFILSLLAFALPTSYALGFFPTISYFFSLLFGLIYMLVMLIMIPFFIFIAWVASLFGSTNMPATDMTLPQQILPPLPEALASSPSPFLEILKAVLFWGILLAVIGYAFLAYLRQNKELMQKLRRMPGLSWLVKAWRWLVIKARGGIGLLPKAVDAGLKRLRSSFRKEVARPMGDYISLRRLESRQKILFYYLALIRRSGESGLPRHPWQTPKNYADTLEPNLPGAETDVESMTQAFVEARYTQHLVSPGQVKHVQSAWDHLRKILNKRRKE